MDIFNYVENKSKESEIQKVLKSFKQIEKTIENKRLTIKYKSEIFPDYEIVFKDDGWQSEYKLFRKNIYIFSMTGRESSQYSISKFAIVILRDVEKKEPFYVLRNGIIFDSCSPELEKEENKNAKKKGYYWKSIRIDDDNFKTIPYEIDKEGNPTIPKK